MGNIGGTELLLIFVLALLLLGPKRLPEIGEALGRTMRRFRQASRELRDELDVRHELDLDDERTAPSKHARDTLPRETKRATQPEPPAAQAAVRRDPAATEPKPEPEPEPEPDRRSD